MALHKLIVGDMLTSHEALKDAELIGLGLLKGFVGGEVSDLEACAKNMKIPVQDVAAAVKDLEKNHSSGVLAGLKELAEALAPVPKAIGSCAAAAHDVEHLAAALASMRSPKAFAFHVGKDLLINRHEIFHEISTAVADYKAGSFEDFGVQIGMALHKLIVGDVMDTIIV